MKRFGLLLFLPIVTAGLVFGESPLSPDLRAKVDQAAERALADTSVPSASVAVVKEGKLVYLHAYGAARLEPKTSALPETRYAVGSISKQFTAAAILMLAELGKLSLDDPVSRFVPNLTRGNEVTIRQLLSHTSGYQDYWPQDYVPPFMTQPIVADRILDLWARKPLDFEPGSEWQYSNTNFVIAGLIIEKASGEQLYKFLSQKIFEPLGMQSVFNIDRSRLPDGDAVGYVRYALGPERVAPKEGAGWLFAAGELAMSAEDLAKWDISVIEQRLMKSSSYRDMETDTRLKNGLGTQYGLGVFVKDEDGHRALEHGGETSGFTAENVIFPDQRAAIVVLTNQDATEASSAIERAIASILFESDTELTRERQERTRKIFDGLQNATLDRSLFTANANSYFSEQVVADFATSLKPLGSPQQFIQTLHRERGGMSLRVYKVQFQQKSLNLWVREMPDGKIEQYQVFAGS